MHILKIIHGYPPDYNAGSEVYSQSICNELSKYHKVSVVTREENPFAPCFFIRKKNIHENLTLYYINNPQGKDGYRHKTMDQNFAELVKKLQPDVAHIGHLNHLSTGFVDELQTLKIPMVFTLHDFWLMCPRGQFLTRSIGKENNFQLCEKQEHTKCALDCYQVYFSGREEHFAKDLERWSSWIGERMQETKALINKVDLFIAPSLYLLNRFINEFGMPENKIVFLDYGFPLDYLSPTQKKTENNVFTFGYIGRHIPAKGIDLLIKAFKKLQGSAALKIYGRYDGQVTKALMKLAEGSLNPIEFCGEYINQNLADTVFSQVDCIVVPSVWAENSPLVIHEAQACKIPVITADFGGMKEYVHHHINGLLFKHRDVDSLTEQMNFAVQHPEYLKQLGERGYLFSPNGQVPDIQTHSKELVNIYQQIMQKNYAGKKL